MNPKYQEWFQDSAYSWTQKTMQEDLPVCRHHFIAGCKLPEQQKEFRTVAVICGQKQGVLRQRAGKAAKWGVLFKRVGRDICHLKQKLKTSKGKNGRITLE